MVKLPYVRLKPEDVREDGEIWGWAVASPELVSALGLPSERVLELPLAGPFDPGAEASRVQVREGLATLFAVVPSHADRTLYLEALQISDPGFERWLSRRVSRAFSRGTPALALRHAVAAVNVRPACAEARFNLGLVLTRLAGQAPGAPDTRRWSELARGEFARAAELSPELFYGYYHRGVLAYEASLPEAARRDWLQFLERYAADKPAPRDVSLRLLPLETSRESAELPGLAYAVLLDLIGLHPARRTHQQTPS